MEPSLLTAIADRLPAVLGLVAFQAIIGALGFREYRAKVRPAPDDAPATPGPFPTPREPWTPLVTALALVQYGLLVLGSAAVFGAIFPERGGLLVLLWIALIVYFALAGMMVAVMFPPTLPRALGVLLTPVALALLLHVTREEPLALSLLTELVFVGIFFTTVLPLVLGVAFVAVGAREVARAPVALLVNLLVIVPLVALPFLVWRDVVPATIGASLGQAPLAWLSVIVSTLLMVGQYYAAWRARVRPLVEAGAV